MKAPLVVIDVQDEFIDQLNWGKSTYLACVCQAVAIARSQDRFVFFVEYATQSNVASPTNERVQEVLKGYRLQKRITKVTDDGSFVVDAAVQQVMPGMKSLRVCGVNLTACVLQTVGGLLARDYSCRLLKEATVNTWYGAYQLPDLEDFENKLDRHLLERAFYQEFPLKKVSALDIEWRSVGYGLEPCR